MDFKQRKLTKSEWEGIEVPVSPSELDVLKLIKSGYENVNVKINKADTLFSHLKMEYSTSIEEFLYSKFFAEKVMNLCESNGVSFITFSNTLKKTKSNDGPAKMMQYSVSSASIVKLKSSDQIRMSRIDTNTILQKNTLVEFVLFNELEHMVSKKRSGELGWMQHFYTLTRLMKINVPTVNRILNDIVQVFLNNYESQVDLLYLVKNSSTIVEKNRTVLNYENMTLYNHQKDIYTTIKQPGPQLVLYIAPTGTGKTLTPIGLSEQYKVIFVCAARHVGLALARSAISVHKKIAFAFGCSSAEDVRLHYFAVKEAIRDKRNGRIKKVDNTVGDKVEIMICDVRSYLPAMYYMAAFNNPNTDIVTFWDEPTISMDCAEHPLHKVIRKNWQENIVSKMVLSSATLPKLHELTTTVAEFEHKFPGATVSNIASNDCRNSIPLVDNNGFVVMPHTVHSQYEKMLEAVQQCEDNLSLLRYLDLQEASNFIYHLELNDSVCSSSAWFSRNITCLNDVNMRTIKLYYLKLLKHIVPSKWPEVYAYFEQNKQKRVAVNNEVTSQGKRISTIGNPVDTQQPAGSSGVYITTKDAHTLTNGPTIFIAEDLKKIASFCIQQANIPSIVMDGIWSKIQHNNELNERIDKLETELEALETKLSEKLSASVQDTSVQAKKVLGGGKKSGKMVSKIANKMVEGTDDARIWGMRNDIGVLKSMARNATLDEMFVPNRPAHMDKWAPLKSRNGFTSDVDEKTVVSIMLLKDVEDSWKVLLLLGIGVFTQHHSVAYAEIMKTLADQQKLYLIIADSDYIYGTNYQFCHGYLGKDLSLTQEKIIQALGRIGRNNAQQNYTIRFRDNLHINQLFACLPSDDKMEVLNMNKLFGEPMVGDMHDDDGAVHDDDDAMHDDDDSVHDDDDAVHDDDDDDLEHCEDEKDD